MQSPGGWALCACVVMACEGSGDEGGAQTDSAAESSAEETSASSESGEGSVDSSTDDHGESSPGSTLELGQLDGPCDSSVAVGGFLLSHQSNFSAISGTITNGVVPANVLSEFMVAGDCRILKSERLNCTPDCDESSVCNHAGECIDYPVGQDVGTVTVKGLKQPVAMEPSSGASSKYFDTSLPHPAYAWGAAIELEATGGSIDPFVLHGVGVEAIESVGGAWIVDPSKGTVVQWQPSDSRHSRILISINIDQHGISPATLVCDTEDDGELEIAADLVAALLDQGISGWTTGVIHRRTVDSTTTAHGCVEFVVQSHISAEVEVPTHTPCHSDDDCQPPQVCDLAIDTCVDA